MYKTSLKKKKKKIVRSLNDCYKYTSGSKSLLVYNSSNPVHRPRRFCFWCLLYVKSKISPSAEVFQPRKWFVFPFSPYKKHIQKISWIRVFKKFNFSFRFSKSTAGFFPLLCSTNIRESMLGGDDQQHLDFFPLQKKIPFHNNVGDSTEKGCIWHRIFVEFPVLALMGSMQERRRASPEWDSKGRYWKFIVRSWEDKLYNTPDAKTFIWLKINLACRWCKLFRQLVMQHVLATPLQPQAVASYLATKPRKNKAADSLIPGYEHQPQNVSVIAYCRCHQFNLWSFQCFFFFFWQGTYN